MASLPLDTLRRIYDAIAENGWASLSLSDVAKATEMDLATLRGHLSSKYDLIGQLNRQIDAEVLKEIGSVDQDDAARDRLFEVMMARFDALEPFKDALGVMAMAVRSDLHLAAQTRRSIEQSMGWMLEAAGLNSGGWKGTFRRNGLALVYVRASLVWLKDETEDLSSTMKAMDQALAEAERWANSVESGNLGGGLSQLRERMRSMADRVQAGNSGGGDRHSDAPNYGDAIDPS